MVNAGMYIRESVDYIDGTDMPRPPYIGKACTRPNLQDLRLLGSYRLHFRSCLAKSPAVFRWSSIIDPFVRFLQFSDLTVRSSAVLSVEVRRGPNFFPVLISHRPTFWSKQCRFHSYEGGTSAVRNSICSIIGLLLYMYILQGSLAC